MVRTRSQLENLSKEELIEELITVDDITSKISDLSNQFDDFFGGDLKLFHHSL